MYSATISPPFDDVEADGWPGGPPAEDANAVPEGRLHASGWSAEIGHNQRWAWVSGSLWLPDASPNLTVTVPLSIDWALSAFAIWGYSSAEVLVHLWVWGSDVPRQSDDRSIARRIGLMLWGDVARGPTGVVLRCDVTRPAQPGAWLRAGVWVEAWNGVAAGVGGTSARIDTQVPAITVQGSGLTPAEAVVEARPSEDLVADADVVRPMAVAANEDGRLEVFARGTDNALWNQWQTAAGNGWSGWNSLGGVLTSAPVVAANEDGRLEVFARGTDNALWNQWQTAAGNGWSGWNSLGGVLTSAPVVAANEDGRLEVFARGIDNALWNQWQTAQWQTAAGNGWSGWNSLGGVLT
jgi:hypothetical protein